VVDMEMSNLAYRSGIAAAHARCAQHSDLRWIDTGFECLIKRLCALNGAGDGIADAHSSGRRRLFALFNNVEMGIEGGDLVGRGLRKPHLLAEGTQVSGRNIVVAILNEVQIFDQEVVAPRLGLEKLADLLKRLGFKLPTLGKSPCAFARSYMSCRPVGATVAWGLLLHSTLPSSLRPLL